MGTEINTRTGHDLDREFDDIKKELLNLSEVASVETEKRKEKMKDLQKDLDSIKSKKIDHHLERLTSTNQKVLETLNEGHRWSFFISGFAILLILAAGLA